MGFDRLTAYLRKKLTLCTRECETCEAAESRDIYVDSKAMTHLGIFLFLYNVTQGTFRREVANHDCTWAFRLVQATHRSCQKGSRSERNEERAVALCNELISRVPLAMKGCDIPAKYLSVELSSGFAMLVSGGSGV